MLTGDPPFRGASIIEVYHAVVYEDAPLLNITPAEPALGRVVRRALAKQPEARYPDARARRSCAVHGADHGAPYAKWCWRSCSLP
jgi:hypothetical protein